MKTIKVKFYCNAGNTEETLEIPIYEGEMYGDEETQILQAFRTWLEANEDCGWEKVYPEGVASILEDGVN